MLRLAKVATPPVTAWEGVPLREIPFGGERSAKSTVLELSADLTLLNASSIATLTPLELASMRFPATVFCGWLRKTSCVAVPGDTVKAELLNVGSKPSEALN